ncbi:hypothetical protein SUGI_0599490 [Cryptomeria japonica]|nr:hypothetical protein SUGI_0599490 [Cryptomeria japonica]
MNLQSYTTIHIDSETEGWAAGQTSDCGLSHQFPLKNLTLCYFLRGGLLSNKCKEEMAKSRVRLAVYNLLVLMAVMMKVKGDPNFWCNCTDYNFGGSTLDYSENCDAQCRPTLAAMDTETSGVGVDKITLHLLTALLGACTEQNLTSSLHSNS